MFVGRKENDNKKIIYMKFSKNHHFIPIFFQNGFCNEDGLIYVYDKILDEIYPPSLPSRRFYAKHLNNVMFNGKPVSSSEETIYEPMDSKGSQVLKKLLDNKSLIDDSTDYDKIDLLHFMFNLFWRTPSSDELLTQMINNEGLCNEHFGLYNKNTGVRLSDNHEDVKPIKNRILNDPDFAKHLKIVISNTNASRKEIIKLLYNWKLFILDPKDRTEFLIGDMPIISYNPAPTLDNILERVIFPLSKNKVLIINENKPNFIDDLVVKNINLSIIKSSKRFIGSGNKEELEYYIDFYKRFSQTDQFKDTIECTFGLIDYLSKFDTFDNYMFNRKVHWG
jgi:hypothetical protein